MVKESAISVFKERLDCLSLSFALDFVKHDFTAVKIDATIVRAPHLSLYEHVLGS